jgi:Tfp pilus assembly PilM family ATPase
MCIGRGEKMIAPNNIKLGLSFSGKVIRMVEAQKMAETLQIMNVAERAIETPFDFYSIENHDLIPIFANYISSLTNEAAIQGKKVSFALERRMAIIKRLIVDRDLSEINLRRHIEWELEQLLISPRDEYNVGFERMATLHRDYLNVVVVAVRKSIIEYLKKIFSQTTLDLANVDIDIFAMAKGIQGHFGKVPKGLIALIDLNDQAIDFTFVNDGIYIFSSELAVFQINQKSIIYSNHNPEQITQIIAEELEKLLAQIKNGAINTNPDYILLTGEKANLEYISFLRKLYKEIPIDFANPFQKVELHLSVAAESLATKKANNFLVNTGLIY